MPRRGGVGVLCVAVPAAIAAVAQAVRWRRACQRPMSPAMVEMFIAVGLDPMISIVSGSKPFAAHSLGLRHDLLSGSTSKMCV